MGHREIFRCYPIPAGEQVTITTMYLSGEAKLWWWTKSSDDVVGRPKIEMWEILKKELKDQFLPTNTAWMDGEYLKKLKQTGSIRNYVKEFSSLSSTSRTCPKSTSCSTSCPGCKDGLKLS